MGNNTKTGDGALANVGSGQNNSAFGFKALYVDSDGTNNTAMGSEALVHNTVGSQNTALGTFSLRQNVGGSSNCAVGVNSLNRNETGAGNCAIGNEAMFQNTSGSSNTAFGAVALGASEDGNSNAAFGSSALAKVVHGRENTAIGEAALGRMNQGNRNIGVGDHAGFDLQGGDANIMIGHRGNPADSNTIRIGENQSHVFLAGVHGVSLGLNDGLPVLVDSAGQLGTVSSTRRLKQDIEDMPDCGAMLQQLRPVSFRYTEPNSAGEKPIQYGLIAEEVAEVLPELVTRNQSDEPEAVKYHVLPVVLLNELSKQAGRLSELDAQVAELRSALRALSVSRKS